MSARLPVLKHGIPPIGIGTYELRGGDCVRAVCTALQLGYRLIDTAAVYRNEELVGQAIETSGVPRSELFIVVKIAMKTMGSDEALETGVRESVRKLRIGYANCVLVHWPGCGGLKPGDAAGHQAARKRCWRVMQSLQRQGVLIHLGVSNFLPCHFADLECFDDSPDLASLRSASWIRPVLNQIELHPLCVQRDVEQYCRTRFGMVLQQYSPLGKGDARLLHHPRLLEVHAKYFGANPARVSASSMAVDSEAASTYSVADLLIMWGLSQGYSTLVRSHRPEHLKANLAAAVDYFASVAAAAAAVDAVGGGGGSTDASDREAGVSSSATRTRPLLTPEQIVVIRDLRHHMGMNDTDEDMHLCWYSSEIA